MKDNYIQLNKEEILKLEIRENDGTPTGEFLEFDLEDIELPLKFQELIEKDKKNKENLRNQLLIISKRQDVKGKKLLSKNEEDKIKAIKEFFEKEIEVYDMFLGKDGVKKLLNGRKIGWRTLNEIDEIIDKQIRPYFNVSMEKTIDKIKEKYGKNVQKGKELKLDE